MTRFAQETETAVDWQDIPEAILSLAIIFLIAFYGGKILSAILRKVAKRSKYSLDDQILEAISPQISWFLLAMGFQIGTMSLSFLDESSQQLLHTVYFLLYLFVIVVSLWRMIDCLIDWYVEKNREKLNEHQANEIVTFSKRLLRIILIILATIVLAGYFGVDILAVTAALGLSGFAIAIAAKDTITNIISGFILMLSQPFRVGDRVEVTSLGAWGEVVEIGIRSSKILMRDNRLVNVPNSVIIDDLVVNYSMPDSTYRLETIIGVGGNIDVLQTQQLIKETVHNLEGVMPDKPVDVWFTDFGESSLTFRVRWWIENFADKRSSTNKVNTAIQELTIKENLVMPNPTLTLENQILLKDETLKKFTSFKNQVD